MSATQPIRNLEQLEELKNYYLKVQPDLRNYTLIHTGINTALRIGDILSLRWQDVYHFSGQAVRTHITLVEQKTGKHTSIAINQTLRNTLLAYFQSLKAPTPNDYLFPGKNSTNHLSRSQAFRIIKQAGNNLQQPETISCHSLRKTFGYHAWNAGTSPALLMVIYNHSSFAITKRYLGIEQEDKDKVFLNLNL